ncbi:hypothetical protein RM553_12815 [Zunongwangia sp. F363]|uniref:Uncharacterized protein n=1 Tax=Autumnicola tepida TaxID=3075595 RepID=A0ABU3CBJ5_9FLAO|nr:hypothetical protein [Zunongwangia sp. F363]MDT0643717.1 hypothetical protein [Zunongwangia sp. F363]
MSKLSAHIVFATYQAMEEEQKDVFVQLMEEEKKKRLKKPKKKKSIFPEDSKWHPDNIEILVAEMMNE